MRRREFIAGLGGALGWPLVAQAQGTRRVHRVGVLMVDDASDPVGIARRETFEQELGKRGWTRGQNIEIYYRWVPGNDTESNQSAAADLLRHFADVLLANGSRVLTAMREMTDVIPIVFVFVSDPVAQGFVQSLSRPGGNITGFTHLDPSVGSKWLGLLKQVAPSVRRVAFVFNSDNAGTKLFYTSLGAEARKLKIEITAQSVRSVEDIEISLGPVVICRIRKSSGS